MTAQRAIQIAQTHPGKLGNKIVSAASCPFTFCILTCSNHSKRELRPIVMRRKVSGQMGSVEGMRRFIHACEPGASEISTTVRYTIP